MKIVKLGIVVSMGLFLFTILEALRVAPGSVKPVAFKELKVTPRGRFVNMRSVLLDPAKHEGDLVALAGRYLQESPELLRAKDSSGATLLSYAAGAGRLQVVVYLLDQGADPSIIDNEGDGPLEKAHKGGYHEVEVALREALFPQQHGAQKNTSQSFAMRDLDLRRKTRFLTMRTYITDDSRNDKEVLERVSKNLQEYPELVYVRDNSGKSLRDHAEASERKEIVDELAKVQHYPAGTKKADTDLNEEERKSLMTAAQATTMRESQTSGVQEAGAERGGSGEAGKATALSGSLLEQIRQGKSLKKTDLQESKKKEHEMVKPLSGALDVMMARISRRDPGVVNEPTNNGARK